MMRRLIVLIVVISTIFSSGLYAQIDFGFTGGLSTPNDNINDVWNSSRLNYDTTDFAGNLFRDGTKIGYNLGIRLRFPLSSNISFVGGISYHRFPQTNMSLSVINNSDSIVTKLTGTQTLIPISVGLNLYLLRSFIGLYGTGDLSYNYILNNVEYKGIPLNVSMSPSDSRVGVGLGLGADVDLKLILLNLEVKYNISNLIGRGSGELSKSYLTTNIAIFFGNSKKQSKNDDNENN